MKEKELYKWEWSMRMVGLIRDACSGSRKRGIESVSQVVEVSEGGMGWGGDVGGSGEEVYRVSITRGGSACTCRDYEKRRRVCKHQVAVSAVLLSREEGRWSGEQWIGYVMGKQGNQQGPFYEYRPEVSESLGALFGMEYVEEEVSGRKVKGYRGEETKWRLWTGALPLPKAGDKCQLHREGKSYECEVLAWCYSIPGYLYMYVLTREQVLGLKGKRVVVSGKELEMM